MGLSPNIPLTTDQAVCMLLGFAVWETHKAYREAAPGLAELRKCSTGSGDYYTQRQNLVDADVTIGLVGLGAGIAAAIMTKRLEPLIFIMATLGTVAWYHHSVLGSSPV
jgi:hypothetical protein